MLKRMHVAQPGVSGDGGNTPCRWHSDEKLALMKAVKRMQDTKKMGSNEDKVIPIAQTLNDQFHHARSDKYNAKDWYQCRCKNDNMRNKLKDRERGLNKEVRAQKQVGDGPSLLIAHDKADKLALPHR